MASLFQLYPSSSSVCAIFISLVSICFIALLLKSCVWKNEDKSNPPPPEAGGAWPIIGHLHLLGGAVLPHRLFGAMADKYGPVFSIRMGLRKAIVVSSWEMAKECLVLNNKAVSSRPSLIAADIMAYGDASIAFTPYGPYWRSLRKIVNLELLSDPRLDTLSYVWREERSLCIKRLYDFWLKNKSNGSDAVLVDLKPWFSRLAMSIIIRIILGETNVGSGEELSHWHKILGDFLNQLGSFYIGDALPFTRWLDFGGKENSMKTTAKEMNAILESMLQDHKQRRLSRSEQDGNKDFMDIMLSVLDDSPDMNDSGFDADTINKATCLIMLAGGGDTSGVFLLWSISLLLNNLDVLKKAQDELRIHIGNNRHVNESDIPKLVYLQAIVKETLRMYPPAPLSNHREFNDDCTVGGYRVKKGTTLIVNLWKIQGDPRVWEDPMEFRPERFLTTHKNVDVRGQCFELIPFGSGRRACPAMSFALRNMHFLLASFLHAFQLSTLDDAPVDMTESSGITNMKATPLVVLVAPRLSVDVYHCINRHMQ